MLLVTHEQDIARHANRIIYIRDGSVEKDEINLVTYGCGRGVCLLASHAREARAACSLFLRWR